MKRISVLFVFFGGLANAQEPSSIITERPSFSASPIALAEGYWQTELGYQYTQLNSDAELSTLPQLLVRFGIADNVELQFDWTGYIDVDSNNQSDSGFSDARISAKWQFSDDNAATQYGILAGVSIPVGEDQFSTDSYDPRIGFLWSHTGKLNWFGTAMYIDAGNTNLLANGIGLSFALSDTTSWFAEHEMEIPEDGGPLHRLNIGWAMLRGLDMQFDVNAGVGLNDRAPDFSLGLGLAIRF